MKTREDYLIEQRNLLALVEETEQHALESADSYQKMAEDAVDDWDRESAERARQLMLRQAAIQQPYIEQLREQIRSIEKMPGDWDVIG